MPRKESRVYLIDQDESVRKSFAGLLKSAGLRGSTFATVAEFLEEPKEAVDCCLLVDIRMAGMAGADFRRMLRERGIRMPVIAVSASDDTGVREEARQLGAVLFFRKPVDDQALLDAIWWALSRQESNR